MAELLIWGTPNTHLVKFIILSFLNICYFLILALRQLTKYYLTLCNDTSGLVHYTYYYDLLSLYRYRNRIATRLIHHVSRLSFSPELQSVGDYFQAFKNNFETCIRYNMCKYPSESSIGF